MDNGIWFTDTHHEHSYTATGPGHTAIGFGQYPGKVGVIGNSFYDRNLKKNVNCVEDPKAKIIGSNRGIARSSVRIDAKGLEIGLNKHTLPPGLFQLEEKIELHACSEEKIPTKQFIIII